DDEDDDEELISPMSDKPPSWSGTRWARFFPELASHFSLASPTSNIARIPSRTRTDPTGPLDSPTSLKSSDSPGSKGRPPSVSSEETTDKRASGYTLRSSITSQSSLSLSSGRNSPYSVHASSPDLLGSFEDDGKSQNSPSRTISRHSSIKELRDKPLPQEPSFQLPPLLARHRSHHLPRSRETGHNNYRSLKSPSLPDIQENYHRPSLSRPAGPVGQNMARLTESQQTKKFTPQSHLHYPDENLQMRRESMGTMATRLRPMSPMSIHDVQQAVKAQSREGLSQTKKDSKNRRSFSFGLPGLNHLPSRPEFRPSGSPFTASALDFTSHSSYLTGDEDKGEVAELPGSPVTVSNVTPTSNDSKQEQFPTLSSLQTKEIGNPGFTKPALPQSTAKKMNEDANHVPRHNKLNDVFVEGSSEKYFVSHSKYGGVATNTFRRQNASQAPTIYELDANPAVSQAKHLSDTTHTGQTLVEGMRNTLPEAIVLTILRQVDSLDDLFNVSLICKSFYRSFKDHELELIKNAVFAMSPPAWELREMSPPWGTEWQVLVDPDAPVPEHTPALYLKHYAQDLCTVAQLKSIILARCSSFLRPDTIRGLSGLDDACATEVDEAFWRVWTFCRLFGCGKHREGDIAGQMAWFEGGVNITDQRASVAQSITDHFDMGSVLFEPPAGFGHGNTGGLSQKQLHSMIEIWTCLGVLLQPMHGKARMARDVGVFNGHNVKDNATAKEEAVLEEWTHYILTLGLSAVLTLGSITTDENTVLANFRKAQSMGLTSWLSSDTVATRSSFLRDAASKAYKPRGGNRSESSSRASSPFGICDNTPLSENAVTSDPSLDMQRRRQAAYSVQLKFQKQQSMNLPKPPPLVEERPISHYEMIISRLEGQSCGSARAESLISAPRGSPTVPALNQHSTAPVLRHPQVQDPTDKAMDLLVRELGFKEEDAKWALKITDSGEGINASAAVSLLKREHRNRQEGQGRRTPPSESLLSSVINSPESRTSGWKWA
ncbi:hypothetical protein ASPACDRAFT_1175, partial [Aspergillus aculeatus ATCC 16872]